MRGCARACARAVRVGSTGGELWWDELRGWSAAGRRASATRGYALREEVCGSQAPRMASCAPTAASTRARGVCGATRGELRTAGAWKGVREVGVEEASVGRAVSEGECVRTAGACVERQGCEGAVGV